MIVDDKMDDVGIQADVAKEHRLGRKTRIVFTYMVLIALSYGLDHLLFLPSSMSPSLARLIVCIISASAVFTGLLALFSRIVGYNLKGIIVPDTEEASVVTFCGIALSVILPLPGLIRNGDLLYGFAYLILTAYTVYFEEIVFRGILCSYSMILIRKSDKVLKAAVLNGLLFGVSHALNLLWGQPAEETLKQMMYASCMGILLCALFLRTGSIWPGFSLHFINNCSSLIASGRHSVNSSEAVTPDAAGFSSFVKVVVIWLVVLVLPAFVLLGENGRKKAMKTWQCRRKRLI